MTRRAWLLTATCCLVAALIATLWVVQHRRTPAAANESEVPKVKLFVAVRDLPKGTRIAVTDLAPLMVPVDRAPQDVVTDPTQAVNALLVREIRKGEPLRVSFLLPSPEQLREFRVPLGLRGFVLYQPFTEGAADILLPGDLVDVIATKRVGDGTVAEVIVQRAQVLVAEHYTPGMSREERLRQTAFSRAEAIPVASAAQSQPSSQPPAPPQPSPQQPGATMRRLVLAVTPQEAVRLARAIEEGRALTVLRNERDFLPTPPLRSPRNISAAHSRPSPVRSPAPERPQPILIRPAQTPVPTMPLRPVRTVVIYRGTQREEVVVIP